LDSRFYGTPDYNTYVKTQLAKLTLADVNASIRQHLKTENMRIAIVTKNGEMLRDAILKNTRSPITYNSPKPNEITDNNKTIETYKVNVKPEDIRAIPVTQVFQ